MKKSKYLKASAKEIILELDAIIDLVIKEVKKIDSETEERDSLIISYATPDQDITFENRAEFKNDIVKIKDQKIRYMFLQSFYIEKKFEKDLYRTITFLSLNIAPKTDGYYTIEIRSSEQKVIPVIDNIFESITKNIFKEKHYYIHKPISETRSAQKLIVLKCREILSKLDQYHGRIKTKITHEKKLQEFLYPILRSHFDDLEEEFILPKFGAKNYKPDFGIPSAKLLIECKYLRIKQDLKKIQVEINDDTVGYLKKSSYQSIIVVIYNAGNIQIPQKYIKDIEMIKGIDKVIITTGVNN